MTAVRGILEHGVQRFPSEYMYSRGYAAHYPTAAAAYIFGINKFSIILPSLLMALGTLWITYLFARDALGRPWLGVAASLLLVTLQVEAFYATTPRMYGALQFFSMLAMYSSWRGFIQDEVRFRILASVAVSLAILSNQQGIVLIAAIPGALLAASYLRGKNWRSWLISVPTIAGILLVVATVYFQFVYQSSDPMPNIAYDNGRRDERIGPTLAPAMWAEHAFNLELAFPYSFAFFLVVPLAIYKLARDRRQDVLSGLSYTIALFAIAGVLSALGVGEVRGARFWLVALPIYAILCVLGLVALVDAVRQRNLSHTLNIDFRAALAAVVIGLAISLGAGIWARGANFGDVITEGYGLSCKGMDCDPFIESAYADLRPLVQPGDVVISSRATVTYHYLGRIDAIMREKTPQAIEYKTEEHFGVPVLEYPEEVEQSLRTGKRVWVIAHSNMNEVTTPELREYLEAEFDKYQSHRLMTTYVGCSNRPCFPTSQLPIR